MLKTFQSTKDLIKEIVVLSKSNKILIQSGHFPILFNSNGLLIPAIKEEIGDATLIEFIENTPYIGDFPLTSFEIGISVANIIRGNKNEIFFVFIVNDWQWLNKGCYYDFIADREEFYQETILPKPYKRLIEKYNFSTSNILKSNHYKKNNLFWSEYKLRKEGKKTIKNCSPSSCAMEYIPFLEQTKYSYDTLISFIPISCKIPILYSSAIFLETNNKHLIHIFYNTDKKDYELSSLEYGNISDTVKNTILNEYHKMELMSK